MALLHTRGGQKVLSLAIFA